MLAFSSTLKLTSETRQRDSLMSAASCSIWYCRKLSVTFGRLTGFTCKPYCVTHILFNGRGMCRPVRAQEDGELIE